jgi:sec-independent protein translocase protein TatB
MFGMGFTEIMFIAVIAILFLGPDKLPEAMVQIAKFIRSVSKTVNEAKSSFEEEVRIKELREEALEYRRKIEEVSDDIAGFKNAIPNPAAEIDNAIASIGGERYLDDDILSDIRVAEESSSSQEPEPVAEPDTADAPEEKPKKPKKKPRKKSEKKARKKSQKEPGNSKSESKNPNGEERV